MKEAVIFKKLNTCGFCVISEKCGKKVFARGKETLTRSPEAKAILEKLEKAEFRFRGVYVSSF
uniref:Uncharacterized protein n=1 Tax=Daphnia galeata TaxID=27404 RepID=A0A8J2S344_9CRUS|nr:unnamed protein product [Daphnia galeata]